MSAPSLSVPRITTDRLLLRMCRPEDAPVVVAYYRTNRAHLEPFEPRRSEDFFTEPFWIEAAERHAADLRDDKALRLLVFRGDETEVVGAVNFSNFIRGAKQSCTLGYSLAEAEQGKGLMSEAVAAAIAHVFENLGFHRVEAAYMPHNVRSGRLLRRLGFVVEGYARDFVHINGKWEDHILTCKINEAFSLF